MDVQLTTHLKEMSPYVTNQLHQPEQAKRRVLWEVYCGAARTAEVAESLGMSVRKFGWDTGWNFELLHHQQAFLELQDQEMPDPVGTRMQIVESHADICKKDSNTVLLKAQLLALVPALATWKSTSRQWLALWPQP